MYSFKQSLLAIVGILVLVVALVALQPLVGQGQGNSGNNPQPLNVNVVNTPTVHDADHPARQPFHAELPFEVPVGKRLVIEYFSAQAQIDPDCHLLALNVSTHLEGQGNVTHSFAPTLTVATTTLVPLNRVTFSHPTRLYADPGIMIGVGHTTSGLDCNLQINTSAVSGHLVDMP